LQLGQNVGRSSTEVDSIEVTLIDQPALDGSVRAAVETVGGELFTIVHEPERVESSGGAE
jgi:hypothetical protein